MLRPLALLRASAFSLTAIFLGLHQLGAETLKIAAASSLSHCLEDLHAGFMRKHPDIKIETAHGASGTLFAQIKNGAPYDVYLSADMSYPLALIAAGLAGDDKPTPYAEGRLVLWSGSPMVDLSAGLPALRSLRRIAIAHPDYVPYGRAAKEALEEAGLWDEIQARLVLGENIAQTTQFVASGNAEAGLLALSVLSAPALKERHPEKYYEIVRPPGELLQGAVRTRRGRTKPAAAAYLQFLRSDEAQEILARHGFSPAK